jgi:hypothetical protein
MRSFLRMRSIPYIPLSSTRRRAASMLETRLARYVMAKSGPRLFALAYGS